MESSSRASNVLREPAEFSQQLDEQKEQLAASTLLQRYRVSREAAERRDPFRPIYHFVHPEGWRLLDPNGLCFWQHRWHLFYQMFPKDDPRQHWGHAVSTDLVQWHDLPPAIYPDPELCCYSGTTLVESEHGPHGRVIAMYHGTQAGNMVAVSEDPLLLNWRKLGAGAAIPIPSGQVHENPLGDEVTSEPQVFDPCIWKDGELYYSLSGGRLPTGPGGKPMRAAFLYESADLEKWTFKHNFLENDAYSSPGDDGACPYFWPIGCDKHVLIHYSHSRGSKYLIGTYDRMNQKLNIEAGGDFNFGASGPSGLHAPSATPTEVYVWTEDGARNYAKYGLDTKPQHGTHVNSVALAEKDLDMQTLEEQGEVRKEKGVVVIFNMNEGRLEGHDGEAWMKREGIMSLPRLLTLGDGITDLFMSPAGDLQALRGKSAMRRDLALPPNQELTERELFTEIENAERASVGKSFELFAEFENENLASVIELSVLRSPGAEEYTRIQFFGKRGVNRLDQGKWPSAHAPRFVDSVVSLDTSASSTLPGVRPRPPETAPVNLGAEERLQLRVFVDRSIVEVFVNQRQCLAARVYPQRADSVGLSLRARGHRGEVRLRRLEVWPLAAARPGPAVP